MQDYGTRDRRKVRGKVRGFRYRVQERKAVHMVLPVCLRMRSDMQVAMVLRTSTGT
jgi:hypothetical protein